MADVTYSSIHVANGQELGDTPQVFVQLAGKRTPRTGETLIVFLDLQNAPPATINEVTRVLSDAYWRAPGGLTTALRLSVKLANDRLVDLNRGVPPGSQAAGSLTCAVINDENVVIAQTGPAIAYARAHSGAFERVDPVGDLVPVGTSRIIDTFFTNYAWQPGDTFVLTGVGSCIRVTENLVKACMAKGEARLVAGYLNANVKDGRMTAVAFTVAAQPLDVEALRLQARAAEARQSAPRQSAPLRVDEIVEHMPADEVQVSSSRTMPPILAAAGAAATAAMGSAAKSIQHGLGSFGSQLLPASTANALSRQRSRTTVFGLASIAILLPILVALLVTILYFQLSGEAEKLQLRNQINQQVAVAKSTSNKDNWSKVIKMIGDYVSKYPGDTQTFADVQHQGQTQLDQYNKVNRVQVAAIVDLGSGSAARRIAAASLGVYVLDTSANTAEYEVLNVQRTGVTGKPVPLTPANGAAPNIKLGDITWATISGGRWRTEGAVLFTQGGLYEYSSATGQMAAMPFPADPNSSIGDIAAGVLYNGTAYVLDAGTGQIWRFNVQANKLVKGDSYFRSPFAQLKDGLDMAIDGAVYILQKSGAILKFFNRQQSPFTINPASLPGPLEKPVAIEVSGNDQSSGSVFIGDAASGAVWQFSKTGEYVRQFRGANDEFVGMQDISLDPTSNTMYVNTANKLFSFMAGQ
jgi:sugar lactone lactonase YvrE